MSQLMITGHSARRGTIRIPSSRNASLPFQVGSYAMAASIVGGPLVIKMGQENAGILKPIVQKLEQAGVKAAWNHDGLEVQRSGTIRPVDVTTDSFPNELLPLWVSLMTQANGKSKIKGPSSSFAHVPQLEKMGATIDQVSENEYVVQGGHSLRGTHVKARDVKSGMALILAGLAAEGTTVVKNVDEVYKECPNVKENLKECGAKFKQLPPTRSGHYGGD